MPDYPFQTVDVFTTLRFGGNPLAVILGASGLDAESMQRVAAEFNLSETTFVLPPTDETHTARVRIFNRTAEMAFAGHPMVGTAFVLAASDPNLLNAVFEIPAGLARIEIARDAMGAVTGARVEAPQPLTLGPMPPPETIARCLGLDVADVILANHSPVIARWGTPTSLRN